MATQLPRIPEVERISPLIIRILGGNPSKFTLQGQISAGLILADAEITKERTPTWWAVAQLVCCSILVKANPLGLIASPRFSRQNILRFLKLSSHTGTLTTLAALKTSYPFVLRQQSINTIRQADRTRFTTASSLRQKALSCEHSIALVTLRTTWPSCWKRRTQCSQATISWDMGQQYSRT